MLFRSGHRGGGSQCRERARVEAGHSGPDERRLRRVIPGNSAATYDDELVLAWDYRRQHRQWLRCWIFCWDDQ